MRHQGTKPVCIQIVTFLALCFSLALPNYVSFSGHPWPLLISSLLFFCLRLSICLSHFLHLQRHALARKRFRQLASDTARCLATHPPAGKRSMTADGVVLCSCPLYHFWFCFSFRSRHVSDAKRIRELRDHVQIYVASCEGKRPLNFSLLPEAKQDSTCRDDHGHDCDWQTTPTTEEDEKKSPPLLFSSPAAAQLKMEVINRATGEVRCVHACMYVFSLFYVSACDCCAHVRDAGSPTAKGSC